MDAFERQLSLLLYKGLSLGTAVMPAVLTEQMNTNIKTVIEALRNWPGVHFDENHNVIGHMGLTIKPTPHQLQILDKTLYTWCAWDGLFIPDLLKTACTFTTKCPITHEILTVYFDGQGGFETPMPGIVMSFLESKQVFDQNIIQQFCHYIYLFKNKTVAVEWIHANPGIMLMLLDLHDAVKLGRLKNKRQYGSDIQ